jgi:hypothetical protein
MKTKLYQVFARKLFAMNNCKQQGNTVWHARHLEDLLGLINKHMPSGSGVDNGTKIDLTQSTPALLVFDVSYHHMNDHGSYDGWTEHRVYVNPDLGYGFNLKITGRNRNDIKDYIADLYREALDVEVEEYAERKMEVSDAQTEAPRHDQQ